MKAGLQLTLIIIGATFLLNGVAAPAHAQAVYSYTGTPFTAASAPFTTSDFVSGLITLSSALPPSTTITATPIGVMPPGTAPDILAFSFSAGPLTITDATADLTVSDIILTTDASGAITSWFVHLETAGGDIIETDSVAGDFAFDSGSGGSASGGPGIFEDVVPEPTSIAIWSLLTMTGAAVGWRRRRQKSAA